MPSAKSSAIKRFRQGLTAAARIPLPTVIRGTLLLPGPAPGSGTACLVDVTGRRVMALAPGPNDVRRLSPGVYYVVGDPWAPARRVVIAR
ncbi:MAG: hypothetical protein R6X12_01800 [bacterium]